MYSLFNHINSMEMLMKFIANDQEKEKKSIIDKINIIWSIQLEISNLHM